MSSDSCIGEPLEYWEEQPSLKAQKLRTLSPIPGLRHLFYLAVPVSFYNKPVIK